MPMEQVIAPGVSYSPEMAGGYTQKDLDMIAAGPAPVMPVAPTQGTPLNHRRSNALCSCWNTDANSFYGNTRFYKKLRF